MSQANSIEQLYSYHESSWSLYCSSNPDVLTLLEDKVPRLLSHTVPENVNQGVELLHSLDESGLVYVLCIEGNSIRVTEEYASNASVIGRSVIELVGSPESLWKELYDFGCFDEMLFTSMGDANWNELSEEVQQKLLKESKRMSDIPAGEFMMGALDSDGDAKSNEKPRHRVSLSRGFLLGKYTVTQALYESVMGEKPGRFKGGSRPVEKVSWVDAVLFCNKLSASEGLEEVYRLPDGLEEATNKQTSWRPDEVDTLSQGVETDLSRNGYRLPTEAEWEYSAKGGEEHLCSGSDKLDEVGWYYGNSGYETHVVGQKKANGFALFDMSSNVREWCSDDWGEEYSSRTAEVTVDPHPTATEIPFRVLRGGSGYDDAGCSRVSFRGRGWPSFR